MEQKIGILSYRSKEILGKVQQRLTFSKHVITLGPLLDKQDDEHVYYFL
jgi:hypothetical protein